jgi:ribonucleoside-diphosphate reductase alpha chain
MKFSRVFTKDNYSINWTKRDACIRNSKGDLIFEQKDVEVPDTWSDNAVNIVASKYFKRIDGVQESSVKQLINRVVSKIVEWGDKNSYFDSCNDKEIFIEELIYLLATQRVSFNSPIWFNFGVPSRSQQAAACFLIGLEDSMESIDTWMHVESKIFQGGSGSGTRASNLRPKNAPIKAGGYSSGPIAFMKASDHKAGAIKSGGTTRRAAKLVAFDVNHPDIKEFITCKTKEEEKAKVLIAAGYDPGIDGEAYTTVAFQNTNHSVQVDDVFMNKLFEKSDDGQAHSLMMSIAKHAWESGDPGVQFIDTINKWNTIPNSGPITTSNPCGEYVSTDWSSCLLASFNLLKFYSLDTGFDFDSFAEAIHLMMVAMDIIICEADYPDARFKTTAHNQRQIGLGYSNLGALLMAMGLSYASEDGRQMASEITSCLTAEAYYQSALLAKEFGAFADYAKNREAMLSLIKDQMETWLYPNNKAIDKPDRWERAYEFGKVYGYRNATTTLLAPTGTISFMMDCDTTGLEPKIGLRTTKSLVGGGHMTLIDSTVKLALQNLHYSSEYIDKILDHIIETGTIEGSLIIDKDLSIFDCALKAEKGTRYIAYQDHMKMMAAVQPYLSMGISKTINMPNSATVEDIYNLYIDAWHMGLKSITVYRDGCKQSQPLNVMKSKVEEIIQSKEVKIRRPLPDERKSITHKIEIAGFEGYLHVGMYDDGTPGEVFINASKQGSTVSGLLDAFATAISYGLQYGVPLEFLVEKFSSQRFEPSGFTKNPDIPMTTSIVDYIFKWLKLKFLTKNKSIEFSKNGTVQILTPKEISSNGHIPVMLLPSNGVDYHTNGFYPSQTGAFTTASMSYDLLNHTGETCNFCGSMMIRTGTCLACHSCGKTLGGCGG